MYVLRLLNGITACDFKGERWHGSQLTHCQYMDAAKAEPNLADVYRSFLSPFLIDDCGLTRNWHWLMTGYDTSLACTDLF